MYSVRNLVSAVRRGTEKVAGDRLVIASALPLVLPGRSIGAADCPPSAEDAAVRAVSAAGIVAVPGGPGTATSGPCVGLRNRRSSFPWPSDYALPRMRPRLFLLGLFVRGWGPEPFKPDEMLQRCFRYQTGRPNKVLPGGEQPSHGSAVTQPARVLAKSPWRRDLKRDCSGP